MDHKDLQKAYIRSKFIVDVSINILIVVSTITVAMGIVIAISKLKIL
jgi:hypothetical protein